MKIPSDEIPQADILLDVLNTVICVGCGGTSYQDIAAFIGKVERQGRYYRKAAEILGFIETPSRNHSVLTLSGRNLIAGKVGLTNPMVLNSVFGARIFQRLIPFLELNQTGVTREEIVSFILSVADISGDSMAPRRFSSVVAWLESLGVIVRRGDKFFLSNATVNKRVPILEFTDIDEPILPRTSELSEYKAVQMRTAKARGFIVTQRDMVAAERADNAYRTLVNLVAGRIKENGSIPRYNQLIDLASRIKSDDYIFEMKSLTPANTAKQIRSGVGQLYEYRYLQNLPKATLVLVVENKPTTKFQWMVDYLESDRGIHVLWDGDNKLFGSTAARKTLNFLGVEPG